MRWVKWIERAPTREDTDDTQFVLTRKVDHEGSIVFECFHYLKKLARWDMDLYWLEGARIPPVEQFTPSSQSASHVRRVEL